MNEIDSLRAEIERLNKAGGDPDEFEEGDDVEIDVPQWFAEKERIEED